ncbi:hypothetical protein IU427_23630 [Nocardia beijingensis]|uniref:hypothetical protein n=1 Tax=Nocardia beijingensis TaxID=95162 RepID=UPI001892DE05|nr:hypothetical protein [Nocardia beijingensis]MBF6468154.1 hypothetical protein [Nocardia beijingensis]
MALSADPFVLAACWFGVGGAGVVSNVALTISRLDVIPEQTLGRAVATMTLSCDGAVALGAGYLLFAVGAVATRWLVLAACVSTRTTRSRDLPLALTSPDS